MGTVFINLPAPNGNGAGAAVDVSAMGKNKSIVVSGSWNVAVTPIITIEINNDEAQGGSWTSIGTSQGGGVIVTDVACRWMRQRVSNLTSGEPPRVNVGSDNGGTSFAALPSTAGNGSGAWVDVSGLPLFKTIQVGGPYQGSVIIEVSEDGQTASGALGSFQSPPAIKTFLFAAHWMRVRRSGVPVIAPGLPVVNIAACSDGSGSGGAADSVDLTNDELGSVPPGTPVYIDAPDGFKRAQADAEGTTPVFGLTTGTIQAGEEGAVQFDGVLELTTDEWDAICGTVGGLAFNVPYYLSADAPGELTATPPSVAGQVIQQVIIAISPTRAKIDIGPAEVIGSGSNIIQLTNDAATPMIIGTPVYADGPGGMNLGIANGTGKSIIVGLVADVSIDPGNRGQVVVGGVMVATADQWDAVADTVGGLTFDVPYYLDPVTPGRLTSVAPAANGQEVVQVIIGISPTEAKIAIEPPILL